MSRFFRAALASVCLAATTVLSIPLAAQITTADYARAEQRLPTNAAKLVFRDRVTPNWIAGSDRFWYRVTTPAGAEFIYVDPARKIRRPAFDRSRLATALSQAADTTFAADSLPFQTLEWKEEGNRTVIVVEARGKRWRCELAAYRCSGVGAVSKPSPGELPSPDGKWALFAKDYNLYLRDLATGAERPLTTDGSYRNDYGSTPEASTSFVTTARIGTPHPPEALWSPDSKRVLTYQLDQRGRPELHLIQSVLPDSNIRPKLWSYVYPLPGDTLVSTAKWVFFDVAGQRVDAKLDPFFVLFNSPIAFQEVWWDSTGQRTFFLQHERGVRAMWLKQLDPATGAVRTLAEERGPTLVEATLLLGTKPNIYVFKDGRSAVWFSQRDGWAHLYLVNTETGSVIRQITKGPWVTRELLRVDEAAGKIYFTAGGREPGRDPYYRHLYVINLDGSGLTLLSPEDAEHEITLSPSGRWAVDRYSRVDLPPVNVVRSVDGKSVLPLEQADITRLLATGWRFPERFTVKAADDSTDLYGIILRPAHFDSTKKYPVIEEIYPGPQSGKVPKAFTAGSDHHALVELGMVGVEVDGRGTPLRSKAFHNFSYRHLETAGALEDHLTAYRQLGRRYSWLDLDRVGIYGHSGGGFASAHAILAYPDFYKVAVSSAGDHDQRSYLALWGETYHGLPVDETWRAQANQTLAKNLKGKLLLAYGDMDDNVHFDQTIYLIDALTKANKDYDLLVLPGGSHAFAANRYFRRRRWDYFVRHLMGQTPPVYEITTPPEYPF